MNLQVLTIISLESKHICDSNSTNSFWAAQMDGKTIEKSNSMGICFIFKNTQRLQWFNIYCKIPEIIQDPAKFGLNKPM